MERLRFALIGCGAVADKHVTSIGRLPDAELSGVYDVNPAQLEKFSTKHKIPVFDDIAKMVRDIDPHVFCILTPSGSHAGDILNLIEYNRHFVVEKPLALRLDQIDIILEQCAERSLKIFVVKQNRFNPPVQKLKEAIDRGRFGRFILGSVRVRWCRDQKYYDRDKWRGTWAYDGGVLTNQASHNIDTLLWLMGDVQSVMAATSTRLLNIEAEDTGAAILKFGSGALGVIEATIATRPKDLEGSLSILGQKGSVEIGGYFMNELKTWSFVTHDPMDEEVWKTHATVPAEYAWNHTEFFRDVIESIRNDRRGLIDGLQGRKSVELINAIYESSETGREVFLRFIPKQCRLGIHT